MELVTFHSQPNPTQPKSILNPTQFSTLAVTIFFAITLAPHLELSKVLIKNILSSHKRSFVRISAPFGPDLSSHIFERHVAANFWHVYNYIQYECGVA